MRFLQGLSSEAFWSWFICERSLGIVNLTFLSRLFFKNVVLLSNLLYLFDCGESMPKPAAEEDLARVCFWCVNWIVDTLVLDLSWTALARFIARIGDNAVEFLFRCLRRPCAFGWSRLACWNDEVWFFVRESRPLCACRRLYKLFFCSLSINLLRCPLTLTLPDCDRLEGSAPTK